MRKAVEAKVSIEPKGPYTFGIISNGPFLFVSGMGPIDPETQSFLKASFEDEAILTFENLKLVVESANASLSDAVKVNVYLRDMDDFETMNDVYRRYFAKPYPARTTVQSNLPGFSIEVDAILALSA